MTFSVGAGRRPRIRVITELAGRGNHGAPADCGIQCVPASWTRGSRRCAVKEEPLRDIGIRQAAGNKTQHIHLAAGDPQSHGAPLAPSEHPSTPSRGGPSSPQQVAADPGLRLVMVAS